MPVATADGARRDLPEGPDVIVVRGQDRAYRPVASQTPAGPALRDMIAWLVDMKGWTRSEAYVFCSLACDLHVTQLVDGNKGIHAMVRRDSIL